MKNLVAFAPVLGAILRPGWLSNLNALLTKKLLKFLPCLNEMSGGRENMCLVSGSLRRILKFLRGPAPKKRPMISG